MSILSRLRSVCLSCFTKPTIDTPVFDAIREHRVRKVVELGVGDGQRALRMIETAREASPDGEVCYVGMDLFEGRAEPTLSLKAAYLMLRGSGAKVQLVPGDPAEGLVRMANALGKVDLLLIPGEFESSAFARFWQFVPRMLHDGSLVFVDGVAADGQRAVRLKAPEEIAALAALGSIRRAA